MPIPSSDSTHLVIFWVQTASSICSMGAGGSGSKYVSNKVVNASPWGGPSWSCFSKFRSSFSWFVIRNRHWKRCSASSSCLAWACSTYNETEGKDVRRLSNALPRQLLGPAPHDIPHPLSIRCPNKSTIWLLLQPVKITQYYSVEFEPAILVKAPIDKNIVRLHI